MQTVWLQHGGCLRASSFPAVWYSQGQGLHWLFLQACRELVLDSGARPSVNLYHGSISHNCSVFPPKAGAGSCVFWDTGNNSFFSMIEFADFHVLSIAHLWLQVTGPKALIMLHKCSTTESNPEPSVSMHLKDLLGIVLVRRQAGRVLALGDSSASPPPPPVSFLSMPDRCQLLFNHLVHTRGRQALATGSNLPVASFYYHAYLSANCLGCFAPGE